jgi:hypothetical protein
MSNLEVTGYWIQGGFWLGVSLIMLGQALKSEGRVRRVLAVVAGAFLAFGVTDMIPPQTSGGSRPVWVLLLKGACLVVLFVGFRQYYRLTRKKDDP